MRSAPEACPYCEGFLVCAPGCTGPHAAARCEFAMGPTADEWRETKLAEVAEAFRQNPTATRAQIAKQVGVQPSLVEDAARKHGLEFDRHNCGRKPLLTREQKADINQRADQGERLKALADEYGVSKATIQTVRNEYTHARRMAREDALIASAMGAAA